MKDGCEYCMALHLDPIKVIVLKTTKSALFLSCAFSPLSLIQSSRRILLCRRDECKCRMIEHAQVIYFKARNSYIKNVFSFRWQSSYLARVLLIMH